MKINEEWSIGSDELQYIVYQTKATKKVDALHETRTTAVAYFTTLPCALSWLVDNAVKTSELKDLKQTAVKLEAGNADILKAIAKIATRAEKGMVTSNE